MAKRKYKPQPGVIPWIEARAKGIVIHIDGDGEGARKALEMVREQMNMTVGASEGAAGTFGRVGSSLGGGVPHMAAASAALRALEGNFTNNIRAGERFLTMLPGMESLLQSAFPVVGAIVLGTALFEMGKKAYDTYENVVMLKRALAELGALDITVGKKLKSDADAIESSTEEILEATKGHKAALEQKIKYETAQPIDLSDFFYDKNFSSQNDNLKANYENLYKSVAPADVPARLQSIRDEVHKLHSTLLFVQDGDTNADGMIGGYGPGAAQNTEQYLKARLKIATDIERELSSASQKRDMGLAATTAQFNKPDKEKHERSDDAIGRAVAERITADGEMAAAAQKAVDDQHIAELEAQHTMEIVSDQEFRQRKLELQNEDFDAQEKALRDRLSTLQQLYDKQRTDKTLKRDANGDSAEQEHTRKEMDDAQKALAQLQAKRGEVDSKATAEVFVANRQQELQALRNAADLERQRNEGLEKQIALIREEHELEARKSEQKGDPADAANIRALGELAVKKLQIDDIDKQISESLAENKRQTDALNDAASKDPRLKTQAAKEINQLNAEEAQQLQALVAQYDALAQVLGGDFLEKSRQLHATIGQLNTPNQKADAQWAKTVGDAVSSMADRMASSAVRGKQSFRDMVKSIEQDVSELIIKLATQKWLTPLLTGMMGGGGNSNETNPTIDFMNSLPQYATGTDNMTGAAWVGEHGPELWTPPAKGGGITPNEVLQNVAKNGGGGGAPNIQMNLINNSSQPVQATQGPVTFDSDSKNFIINTILEDHANGGPMSALGKS